MPTEIEPDGYETLRQTINSSLDQPAQWDYLSIRDENGDEILRVSITDDSRAEWLTTDPSSAAQECQITVSGDDAEINLPVTISGSALYNVDTGGNPMHVDDSMADAPLAESADEVVVTHTVEGPVTN